jgi:hypothetical protein
MRAIELVQDKRRTYFYLSPSDLPMVSYVGKEVERG